LVNPFLTTNPFGSKSLWKLIARREEFLEEVNPETDFTRLASILLSNVNA